MQKLRRILALLGVVILVGMYLVTLVFALSSSPNATNMLMASIACTVIIPCLLYGMILIARVLGTRNPGGRDIEAKDTASTAPEAEKNPKAGKKAETQIGLTRRNEAIKETGTAK